MAELGLSFEGANGQPARDNPGSNPSANQTHPSQSASAPPPSPQIPPSSPPAQGSSQEPSQQSTSAQQQAQQSAQEVQRQLVQAIASKHTDLDLPSDWSDDDLIENVVTVLQSSQNGPTREEIEQFQKYQPLVQQWLAQQGQQALHQGQGGNQPQSQQSQQKPAKEEKPKERPEWLENLEPIEYELPEVNPMARNAERDGLVTYDPRSRSYQPSKGYEANSMVLAAANELNEYHKAEMSVIEQWRTDPLRFTQRAAAPLLEKLWDYFEEKIGGSRQEFSQFRQQLEQVNEQEYFTKNKSKYFQVDEKGNPKIDLKTGRFVQTQEGNVYGHYHQEAQRMGMGGHEAFTYALEKTEEWKSLSRFSPQVPTPVQQVQQQPPQQAHQTPEPQQNAQQPPQQSKQEQQKARKMTLLDAARQKANARGNGASPTNRVSNVNPEPNVFSTNGSNRLNKMKAPSFAAIVQQVAAQNS